MRIVQRFLATGLLVHCSLGWGQTSPIQVVVLEGNEAINNIHTHTGHDPVVEVRDAAGQPVQGATVTFQLPPAGASAAFPSGQREVVAQTDERGQAAAHGLRPNSLAGPFSIRVTASIRGETASAAIRQTNASPGEAKGKAKYWILGAIIAGGAGGALAATHGKSSSNSPATTTSSTGISAGSPSFGPPH